jgi:hypothetical protein
MDELLLTEELKNVIGKEICKVCTIASKNPMLDIEICRKSPCKEYKASMELISTQLQKLASLPQDKAPVLTDEAPDLELKIYGSPTEWMLGELRFEEGAEIKIKEWVQQIRTLQRDADHKYYRGR